VWLPWAVNLDLEKALLFWPYFFGHGQILSKCFWNYPSNLKCECKFQCILFKEWSPPKVV
jgi:hypothetical protein